jgi:hypothetical protein
MCPSSLFKLDLLRAKKPYHNLAGDQIPGVTTVLSVISKPELITWANREGLAGRDTTKQVQRAADIGTATHGRIEAFVRGQEVDSSDWPREVVVKSMNGHHRFVDWWEKSQYVLAECELPLVSEMWQVGGTLDILANGRDGLDLIDIKTSKRIYAEHRIQASAYAAIYEEKFGVPINSVWIVRVGKEAEDDIETLPVGNRTVCVEAFRAALALYRAMRRV